jgi:hypothetical protein
VIHLPNSVFAAGSKNIAVPLDFAMVGKTRSNGIPMAVLQILHSNQAFQCPDSEGRLKTMSFLLLAANLYSFAFDPFATWCFL